MGLECSSDGTLNNACEILVEKFLGGKERGEESPYRFVTRVNV